MKRFIGLILVLLIASLQAKEHVIILHGIGRSSKSMKKIEKRLTSLGYNVHNQNYPSTEKNIAEISNSVIKPLVEYCYADSAEKIHFVTHSMGGIVVRYFLQHNQIPKDSKIVMLAPPNQGSQLTNLLKDWLLYKKLYGPAGQQLGKSEESLVEKMRPLQNYKIGVIAGQISIEPWFSPFIEGEDDGKVAVESTKLEEMDDFLIVNATHTFIMYDKKTLEAIESFLKRGYFPK